MCKINNQTNTKTNKNKQKTNKKPDKFVSLHVRHVSLIADLF